MLTNKLKKKLLSNNYGYVKIDIDHSQFTSILVVICHNRDYTSSRFTAVEISFTEGSFQTESKLCMSQYGSFNSGKLPDLCIGQDALFNADNLNAYS